MVSDLSQRLDRPIVLDEVWLPGARFRGLSVERLDAWHGPLYALFETEFGVRMIGAAERLKAVAADRSHARALHVVEGAPLLLVERVDIEGMMRQSRELGLSPQAFLGAGAGFANSQFAKETDVSNGVFSSTQWTKAVSWPGAKDFAEKYEKRYGKPGRKK